MPSIGETARRVFDILSRVWSDPQGDLNIPSSAWSDYYGRMWDYYSNQAFADLEKWARYKEKHGLYRFTRMIYNPGRRLVEFYVSEVYPGLLQVDDTVILPDTVPSAIPINEQTSPALRRAIRQFWQWSNWQSKMDLMVRYSGAVGACLVEIEDDIERRKVTARVWWPGKVVDKTLNAAGDVIYYALEYLVPDTNPDTGRVIPGKFYVYRKEVDKQFIRTYRDGKLFDYTGSEDGTGHTMINPYGFVPAVWVPFYDMGDAAGLPIIWALTGKLDELNGLVSAGHDQLFKIVKAPVIVSGEDVPDQPNERLDRPDPSARDKVRVMRVPPGTSIATLPLSLGEMLAWVQELLKEIERDHPELTMYEKLSAMSAATGPSIDRLLGNVGKLVASAQAVFDTQTIKLCQMGVAIGGMRANAGVNGGWGLKSQLTSQQAAFLGFDLTSYQKGALNFNIDPRPLVPPVEREVWETELAKANALTAKKQIGVPTNQLLLEDGYSEKQITDFGDQAAQDQAALGEALLRLGQGAGANPAPNTQDQTGAATSGTAGQGPVDNTGA